MRILVDTSVWSATLRRGRQHPSAAKLRHHIVTGSQIYVLGIIIQEVLQGIRPDEEAAEVYEELMAFELLALRPQDYRGAAQLHKRCRAFGSSVGTIDCLIAWAAISNDCVLHTLDDDFGRVAECSELKLMR